jgi:hypothetical protein
MLDMNDGSRTSSKERNGDSLTLRKEHANTTVWSQRFIVSAILQGSIIVVLTSSGIAIQLLYAHTINIIQFLSLSFEGPAKWIFFGYLFYLILITMIATTAIFYNHLEANLQKRVKGFKSILAWANLIGINVGGAAVALTIIYAGFVGSGILDLMISGSATAANLKQNTAIMNEFVLPISAFAGILIIGAVVGTIAYFATYFSRYASLQEDRRAFHEGG